MEWEWIKSEGQETIGAHSSLFPVHERTHSIVRCRFVPVYVLNAGSHQSQRSVLELIMAEEDTESRCSIPVGFSPTLNRNQKLKVNIYNQVLVRLKYSDIAEAQLPGFEDQLWAHFNRLPTRSLSLISNL